LPYVDHGVASLYFEDRGEGFPLLALAPGGLSSAVDRWPQAAIDPLTACAGDFRLLAMDQRNAGRSRGPLEVVDPWGAYIDDQLAVLDHAGVERFHVIGCCIGCSYALKLIERAPERVVAAVLEQPIGLVEANHEGWVTRRSEWAAGLMEHRDDVDTASAERFGAEMFDGDFVGAVSRDFVASVEHPLLVLPGTDLVHPRETGLEIAELAPGAELLDPWKDDEHVAAATLAVRDFLVTHTPSS